MITKLIFSKNVESSAMVAHKNPTLLVLLAFGNYFIIYKNFWKLKLLLQFFFVYDLQKLSFWNLGTDVILVGKK